MISWHPGEINYIVTPVGKETVENDMALKEYIQIKAHKDNLSTSSSDIGQKIYEPVSKEGER